MPFPCCTATCAFPTSVLEPDLAASWRYDRESFTWTIHLRPDARFHDGQPVTSRDVTHSLRTCLSRHRAPTFGKIEEIVPVTDTSLRLALRENDPDFLLAVWDVEIVPESGAIDGKGYPIGSGPFRYLYRTGSEEIVLVANQDYFGGRPAIDRVVFHAVPDSESSLARLLGGKTDIAGNTRDPLFDDPRVRTALTMAVDRTDLVKTVLDGRGTVTVGPVDAESPYHDPATAPLPFDPSRSLELLQNCGWSRNWNDRDYLHRDAKPFDFTLLVPEGNRLYARVAAYLRLAWNGVGIKVRLRYLPKDRIVWSYRENGEFQAASRLSPVLRCFGSRQR